MHHPRKAACLFAFGIVFGGCGRDSAPTASLERGAPAAVASRAAWSKTAEATAAGAVVDRLQKEYESGARQLPPMPADPRSAVSPAQLQVMRETADRLAQDLARSQRACTGRCDAPQ